MEAGFDGLNRGDRWGMEGANRGASLEQQGRRFTPQAKPA
jgi:hypothetical protein